MAAHLDPLLGMLLVGTYKPYPTKVPLHLGGFVLIHIGICRVNGLHANSPLLMSSFYRSDLHIGTCDALAIYDGASTKVGLKIGLTIINLLLLEAFVCCFLNWTHGSFQLCTLQSTLDMCSPWSMLKLHTCAGKLRSVATKK